MKIKTLLAPTLALFLLSLAAPLLTGAQAAGQVASGTYQFAFEDGYTKYVEFDAKTLADGSTTGQMFLSDEATLVYSDLDGNGDPEGKYPGFYIKADFDELTVNKNQAVMSGTIRDSSIRELIGQRVLLTVEDNGDNTREPDKLTWGIYKPVARNWKPSDAELKEDPGVGLRWVATDAELKDDVGIEMPRSEEITSKSFPVSSYAFVDIKDGAGDIIVRS
jgi:hypothetical protein